MLVGLTLSPAMFTAVVPVAESSNSGVSLNSRNSVPVLFDCFFQLKGPPTAVLVQFALAFEQLQLAAHPAARDDEHNGHDQRDGK